MKIGALKNKIKGPTFSIVTPFKKDGNIDYSTLFKNLTFYYKNGVRIFYLMFYNSRLGLLSEEEVFKLNYKIAKFLKKKFKNTVFIGASKLEGSADEIIKRTKKLSKSGVDVFSIIFGDKYYNDNQVYSHFKYINDNTSLPLLLHLQMMMNGYGIKPPIKNYSINLAEKICSLKNFIAIKDDAKNNEFTIKLIKRVKQNVSIIRAGGGMTAWKKYNKLGCQSWLVGLELIDPKLAFDFVQALKKKDNKFLNIIEKKIENPFYREVKKYGWHIFIKSCLEDCGIMSRKERLPLKELSSSNQKKISKFMVKLRHLSKKFFKKEYFKRIN